MTEYDKLYYKLLMYAGCKIKIMLNEHTVFYYEFDGKPTTVDIITIWKKNDKYHIFINDHHVDVINDYDNIVLYTTNAEKYEMSINYALSINGFTKSHFENWNYITSTFSTLNEKYQINIQHLDSLQTTNIENIKVLDSKILELNCNYIFVDKLPQCHFNLGYCRNLYKYLSWSNNILFSDVDIYIPKNVLEEMSEKIKQGYHVVKPYKTVIYSTPEQKMRYLQDINIDNNFHNFVSNMKNESTKKLFSISGGLVLFTRDILTKIGGFTEINGYGFEDRFMDIHLQNYENIRIYQFEYSLLHLYHDNAVNKVMPKNVLEYNSRYYNCFHHPDNTRTIHDHCNHHTQYLSKLEKFHQKHNGQLNLFKTAKKIFRYPTLKILPF